MTMIGQSIGGPGPCSLPRIDVIGSSANIIPLRRNSFCMVL